MLAALVSPLHTRATQLDSDTLPSWDCFSEQINSLRDHMTALAIARLTQRAWDHALAFEYDAAIDTASHAITLAPDDPAPYVLRGQMILLLYEWDRALADFDQAIMLDPTYAPAYYQRATLYYTLTQREAALNDLRRYLQLAPSGAYAEDARAFIDSLQTELEALSAP